MITSRNKDIIVTGRIPAHIESQWHNMGKAAEMSGDKYLMHVYYQQAEGWKDGKR